MCRILSIKKNAYWVSTCLELNIMAQGATYEDSLIELNDAIVGYLDTVYDTNDSSTIQRLLQRRAPIYKWVIFYFSKLINNTCDERIRHTYCVYTR